MSEADGETFLEFQQVGNVMKVTAIDPVSLEEVSIVAPLNATRGEMTRIAVQKLQRRISQLNSGDTMRETTSQAPTQPDRGRGILV